jgi:hypothetical protein
MTTNFSSKPPSPKIARRDAAARQLLRALGFPSPPDHILTSVRDAGTFYAFSFKNHFPTPPGTRTTICIGFTCPKPPAPPTTQLRHPRQASLQLTSIQIQDSPQV